MSHHIPFEIQAEIIQHLPVRSLLRLRTLSESWKSFIDSPNFISNYPNQSHHLLITYQNSNSSQSTYISIADDDTFPQNKLSATLPPLIHNSTLVGSSHGLICFCFCHQHPYRFVLWNPSIQKSIPIQIPLVTQTVTAFGFGVCPVTKVPKLVVIDNDASANVYSLSSGVWRISSANLPNNSVRFDWCHSQVTVDRFVYWFGTETNSDDGDIDDDEDGDVKRNLVISFDLSNEVFEQIHLPDDLADYDSTNYLCKRNNSLAVVQDRGQNETGVFEVWVMEDGDSKAFTKMFTVKIPYESAYMSSYPFGFNRNGEILMVINEGSSFERKGSLKVVVCKPWVEGIEDVEIEIDGELESLNVCSYTESLLLLDV